MRVLFRRKLGIYFIIYIIIFTGFFTSMKINRAIAKELNLDLYIIEEQDFSELVVDTYDMKKYKIEEISFIDLNSKIEIKAFPVNERFFIYEKLKNNREYAFQVKLIDNKSGKRALYKSKFKYLESKISVKNITVNSCDLDITYNRKNLIFIDKISIYGKVNENKDGNYDFLFRKNSSELENYKDKTEFYGISLKPNTNYDIYCSISVNNNVSIISKRKIRSKNMKVSKLNSSMISDRKIKLDWDISNKNLKFLENDSIKIYVKKYGDWNYSQKPNFKITKDNVYSLIMDLEKVCPSYDIKLVYSLSGTEFIKTVKQVNNFHKLNSKVKLSRLRDLEIKFGFDNKFKFKDGEMLNIYLIDKMNENIDRKKIFSEKINSIEFTPQYSIRFNDIKLDNDYKILYEIVYNDGTTMIIKEDEFKTLKFGIKNFNVIDKFDKQNNLKVNLSWDLKEPKFKFLEGDSLSVYIKEKGKQTYDSKPYFYKNKGLNSLFSIDIDVFKDVEGFYDIKLVYNVGGNEYSEFKELYINSKKLVSQNFSSNVTSSEVDQITQKKGFYTGVRDTRVNEVVLELLYDKNFEFTDGDLLQIYVKEKDTKSTDKNPYLEYKHVSSGHDKLDLRAMRLVKVSSLIPNKDYEFEVVLKTKNTINDDGVVSEVPDNKIDDEENIESSKPEDEDIAVGDEGDTGTEEDEENKEEEDEEDKGEVAPDKDTSVEDVLYSNNQLNRKEKKLETKTKEFKIKTFSAEEIRTNSAVFKWDIEPNVVKFNEDDKVEIFIKRSISNGYPSGSSFEAKGNDIKKVLSGEVVVKYMDTKYDAKLVYTISGIKHDKIIEFTTKKGSTSCKLRDITETTAVLDVVYPEGYKFLKDDSIEIFMKEEGQKSYGPAPLFKLNHGDGLVLEDIKSFNLNYLKPKMVYDILVKFINKSGANDIPDATAQFITSTLILQNCRIDSMNGDKLRIKTDVKNQLDVFNEMEIYLDVFYKEPDKTDYISIPILSKTQNLLDFEIDLPNIYKDYDFLVSFNPHGFFNETLFIEFELEYRTIRAVIDETLIEDKNGKRKSYDLKWAYTKPVNFSENDKINIYLKEIIENEGTGSENQKKDIIGYNKIHTIDSGVDQISSFNLDYFINENKKYEFLIEIVSDKFKSGIGMVELSVGKIIEETNEDIKFDVPISIEDYEGLGDTFKFNIPELGKLEISESTNLTCDIEGVFAEFKDNGISVRGLVPGKEYPIIEVRMQIELNKELVFNIENIKLEPEGDSQKFLYDVYRRSFLRDPDEVGYQYWINRLKSQDISARDFLINLLFAENEFSEMKYSTDEFISVLYSIIVDRDPDKDGLSFWINFYNQEAIKNSNGDVFIAKKYIVDRMINEDEFEKLILKIGFKY